MNDFAKLTVTSLDGTIHIKGILFENSNFFGLSEALESKFHDVDLSGLSKASWNGLLRLNQMLIDKSQKLGHAIPLRHVPFAIYKFVRMLPGFADHYLIREAELPFLMDGNVNCREKSAEALQLCHASDPEAGFFEFRGNELAMGRKPFFPGFYPQAMAQRSYRGVADFLLDYSHYSEAIFAVSSDLAEGLGTTIKRINAEMVRAREKSQAAFRLMNFAVPEKLWAELENASKDFDKSVDGFAGRIASVSDEIRNDLEGLGILFQASVQSYSDPGIDLIQKLAESTFKARSVTSVAEDLGVTAGGLFVYTEMMEKAQAFMAFLGEQELTAELIQQLIDLYGICDPMADEKEYLIENIQEIYKLAENEIFGLSTASQGCDLVRQIMEHRIREAEVMDDFLKNFGNDILVPENAAMLQSEVIQTIKKKLVTDQEKYALAFFVVTPEEAPKAASAQPGDMLMF